MKHKGGCSRHAAGIKPKSKCFYHIKTDKYFSFISSSCYCQPGP